jgi:hypothetical protein
MKFPMDFWLFWICFIRVLFKVITNLNLTIAVLSKTTFGSIFVSNLCAQEFHWPLDDMDLKIYTLAKKTRDCVDSWQNYLCDFHLCFPFKRLLRPMEKEFYIKTTNGSSWT